MQHRFSAAFAALVVLLAACAPSQPVTRQIQIDETFGMQRVTGTPPIQPAMDLRMKVIALGGMLELCGAVAPAQGQERGEYLAVLSGARFLVDGRPVIEGLDYFTFPRSVAPFTTDRARCKPTGLPIPTRPLSFAVEIQNRTYQLERITG
jgi:hypothetical protein